MLKTCHPMGQQGVLCGFEQVVHIALRLNFTKVETKCI